MAQSPFLVDVIQIEPGSGQTLTVSRNSADGSLKFIDTLIPAGVTLTQLSGLRNITGVYVVGRGGSGAPYTTIQEALDAISITSTSLLPSLVLVMPGVYTENLSIQKDGVNLVGLGGVKIKNSGASDTITISASLDVVPKNILIRNLNVTNNQASKSCVKILGADSFASGEVTVTAAPLSTGDTVTIDGNVLTGVAGIRTSGDNNFSVSSGTVAGIAAEIVAALNDSLNSFSNIVFASSALGVVTIEAVVAGSDGNAISLAVSADNLTVSGAFLAGGGSADNLVGSERILIDNCELVASGVGGLQVLVDTANCVFVRGGTFYGSSSTSEVQVSNTSIMSLENVSWINNINLSYNTAADTPDDTTCNYIVENSPRVLDVISTLVGAGSLEMKGCAQVGSVTVGGDRTFLGKTSNFTDVVLSGTVQASLRNCSRTTASVAGGTPTLEETVLSGTIVFTNSSSETVEFDVPNPDSNYRVSLESPTVAQIIGVTAKDENGFTVEFSGLVTGTVGWVVQRNITV